MRRDAGSLAALFQEDADFVNVVGLWWSKRRDIQKAHAYGLRTFFRDSSLTAEKVKVKYLGDGTVATVHVSWLLQGQLEPDGSTSERRRSVMVLVAEKEADGWRVAAAQNVDVVSGAETMSSTTAGVAPVTYR
eukprot:TRINITY_DN23347_c0_g1_i1.p1 TRINITY_DN23347_c0_g1~~TRINITY_DN23347_c0_g1_i1.p1  ORF type:complete len:133 (-),score=34.96 TRINITY_DN23347_c0_g1_i1:177-575(-)